MNIDINKLTDNELLDLNQKIVARLKSLQQIKIQKSMKEFRLGDRVSFSSPNGEIIEGMLTKQKKKTVNVMADDGIQWTVSPGLLKKINGAPNMFDQEMDKIIKNMINHN